MKRRTNCIAKDLFGRFKERERTEVSGREDGIVLLKTSLEDLKKEGNRS